MMQISFSHPKIFSFNLITTIIKFPPIIKLYTAFKMKTNSMFQLFFVKQLFLQGIWFSLRSSFCTAVSTRHIFCPPDDSVCIFVPVFVSICDDGHRNVITSCSGEHLSCPHTTVLIHHPHLEVLMCHGCTCLANAQKSLKHLCSQNYPLPLLSLSGPTKSALHSRQEPTAWKEAFESGKNPHMQMGIKLRRFCCDERVPISTPPCNPNSKLK